VELMANSDNVLRAGLTPKHIDVNELLSLVSCKAEKPEILHSRALCQGAFTENEYPRRANEFTLSIIEPRPAAGTPEEETVFEAASPEILFCGGGQAVLETEDDRCTLAKGESVFVPASQKTYTVKGSCTLYRARV
jgi:mannose-6-phosphate isomerase